MLRITSFMCGLTACGLLAWVGYIHFRTEVPTATISQDREIGDDQSGGLMLDNSEQDLGEIPLGEHAVFFRVVNHSSHDAELIGNETKCISGCCFGMTSSDRMPIPRGATVELDGKLFLGAAGRFEYSGRVFLNDGGQLRSLGFKLKGAGVPAEKPNAPPP